MTNPEDPQRWGQPGHSDPSYGQGEQQPYSGPPQQEPATGSTVSYNAAAFDDEADHASDDSTAQPPASGSYPTQPPVSGSYPSQPPVSGSYPAQPPASGTHSSQPPVSGSYPAQGDPYGQPASGSFAAQPPVSDGYPAQQAGYPQPTSGSYPAQPYESYPASGAYAVQSAPAGPTGPGGPAGPGWDGGGSTPGGRSKKPLWLGLGALALVGALIAAYFVFFSFGGIKNGKGEIKNAKSFLSQAESTWKESLPEEGITVSKDAGCYYALNDSGDITNQIACGPARRAASEKGALWDYYHFNVTGSGDSQQAGDLQPQDVGLKEPSKGELVDVDGNGPEDDGEDLKEPPLPKAEKDGVWTSDQFVVDEKSKGNDVELGSDPRLVGPGAQVVVNSISEYSVASIDGQASQAADGQKLFLIDLTGDPGPISGYLTNTLSFDLNGTSVEVEGYPDSLGTTQLLVSVPASGTSNLVLDSEGHQQMLDLSNGERAEDKTTELYYTGTPEPTVTLSDTINFPATSITPTEAFSLSVSFWDAKLTPYDPEYGWAPAGQHWLIVSMGTDGITSAVPSSFQYYKIDCQATSVSGGTMKSCLSDAGASETATLVAAVTPGTKQFSVNFAATLEAWGDAQSSQFGGFGPSPVSINFP